MHDGERLKKNLDELGYDATNLLSCMTLNVENLHSVVHHKSGVSTALQYARDFGSTAKKSLKRTTAWSAYYYTTLSTQSQRDRWDCLKLHRCHKPGGGGLPYEIDGDARRIA